MTPICYGKPQDCFITINPLLNRTLLYFLPLRAILPFITWCAQALSPSVLRSDVGETLKTSQVCPEHNVIYRPHWRPPFPLCYRNSQPVPVVLVSPRSSPVSCSFPSPYHWSFLYFFQQRPYRRILRLTPGICCTKYLGATQIQLESP